VPELVPYGLHTDRRIPCNSKGLRRFPLVAVDRLLTLLSLFLHFLPRSYPNPQRAFIWERWKVRRVRNDSPGASFYVVPTLLFLCWTFVTRLVDTPGLTVVPP